MPTPTLSVITPSFNSGKYIEDAILSVSLQRGVSIEHIVMDGGSTDGTLHVVANYPNLRWTSAADAGQSDAINKGFLRATGDLVGWLNADDYYLPGGLAAIARAAQQHPEADVVYGDCVFVDGAGKVIRSKVEHDFDRGILRHFGCYIPSTSTFFRKRVIERGFLLTCEYRVAMDFEYFVRLDTAGFRFHYVPQFIAAFRWHDDNISLRHAERRARERLMVQRNCGLVTDSERPQHLLRHWSRLRRVGRKITSGNILRELAIRGKCGRDILWMRASEALPAWTNSESL